MDITQLILDDHHEQRRRFAMLDQIDRADTAALDAVWQRLATFLEVHAAAEEKFFYPALLELGKGAGSKDSADAETEDAIGDHNEIRDAVAKVASHAVGDDAWFDAIALARKANSTHMGEEERESLADFRRHAGSDKLHRLAVAFAAFEGRCHAGVDVRNRDAESYIEQHKG
ncbi:MAG: cation-binding protein [Rhodanobacter sp.]|nr:MAG: cation-binding protein [Rhodanobacter sp.]